MFALWFGVLSLLAVFGSVGGFGFVEYTKCGVGYLLILIRGCFGDC